MKTYWAFLAGADTMGMIVSRLIGSAEGFVIFGFMFMVAFYFVLFRDAR
jgi:hypothetical protein